MHPAERHRLRKMPRRRVRWFSACRHRVQSTGRLSSDRRSFPGPDALSTGQSNWIYRKFVVSYYNQCAGVSLSWEDNEDRSLRADRTWTFIVTLKDVGNYLRYRQSRE